VNADYFGIIPDDAIINEESLYTSEQVEDIRGQLTWKNPNILLDFIEELQKVIEFTFELEGFDKKLEMVLGEERKEQSSETTLAYKGPTLFISLARRSSTGTNKESLVDLFKGNLISGVPKFRTEQDKDDGTQFALINTDNELKLVLKTKTVKEQFEVINILERSLNVYSPILLRNFVQLCGVTEIKTEDASDKADLYTSTISFQARLKEIVEINRTFILKYFEIYFSKEEDVSYASGIIDGDNVIDNIKITKMETF
jgi:hypothetical protein